MKYFVFNYKETKLQCFDSPIITTENPQNFVESVCRTLKQIKPFDYQFAKDKVLYYFGTFDDNEGNFELLKEPESVLIVNEHLPVFDEVVDNYKKSTFRDEKNDALIYRLEFNLEREKLRAEELAKHNLVADLSKEGEVDGRKEDKTA